MPVSVAAPVEISVDKSVVASDGAIVALMLAFKEGDTVGVPVSS